jgi:hypothetical protein
MGAPVPFRTKKGEEFSAWKAVVQGKIVELAPNTATQEEATAKLTPLLPTISPKEPQRKTNISSLFGSSVPTVQEVPTNSTDSKDTSGPISDKPKPGEIRKNGLAELTPARLKAFRDQVAFAIASGNVSLDRALVSIFRDKVPLLAPEQHLLLSTGWELACEQYFVNGVPPAWIIILLGNAMVCTALYEKSEPKKEEELPKHDGTIGNPPNKGH